MYQSLLKQINSLLKLSFKGHTKSESYRVNLAHAMKQLKMYRKLVQKLKQISESSSNSDDLQRYV